MGLCRTAVDGGSLLVPRCLEWPQAVSGCLALAWFLDGRTVETVESLETAQGLDPVQQAFIDAGAFQCGFCTPGFILMVKQLLDTNPDPSDDDIRHYLAGNLCRCSAYPEILNAVRIATKRRAEVAANA